MSISGLVVHTRPEKTDGVHRLLSKMEGVEVHTATEDGRLVVTVDQPDNRKASDTFLELQNMEGVLSASLVYNYFEQDRGEKELSR